MAVFMNFHGVLIEAEVTFQRDTEVFRGLTNLYLLSFEDGVTEGVSCCCRGVYEKLMSHHALKWDMDCW